MLRDNFISKDEYSIFTKIDEGLKYFKGHIIYI
jgi:hypothetical protein